MIAVAGAQDDAAGRLRAAGIDDPRREARLLLAHALGVDPAAVLAYPERAVAPAAQATLDDLVARRAARVPMAQLLGVREFWSLPFKVTPDVLTPRPDSETLVAATLAHLPDRNPSLGLLDFGSGSGCLLLALLSELPAATGVGVDASAAAVAVGRDNAAALGLAARARFQVGGWAAAPAGPFDAIVCNPPYVPSGDIAGLEPEVARHDPHAALDGGADGLTAYRAVLPEAAARLAPAGIAVLELGVGQRDAVAGIAAAAGLTVIEVRGDLGGVPRALVLGWAGAGA